MTTKKTGVESLESAKSQSNDGWGEPLESDFFRFENPGDILVGKLVEKSEITIRGKPGKKYKVENDSGTIIAFNGGTKIDDVLEMLPLGIMVRIEFTGYSEKTASGNRMKNFDIRSK